jgi:hypothetical protein
MKSRHTGDPPYSIPPYSVRPDGSVSDGMIDPRPGTGHNHPMVVVPAWVWRGGPVCRAVSIGLPTGIFFGALVFADSGQWLGALIAVLVLSPFCGIMMVRRMARFWPGANDRTTADRLAVVRATRGGTDIGEARLALAVIDYSSGLHESHEQARPYRWLVRLFAALALILALSETFFGSIRGALVSWLFVAFLVVELVWWPRTQAHLLSNAERAEKLARQLSGQHAADED